MFPPHKTSIALAAFCAVNMAAFLWSVRAADSTLAKAVPDRGERRSGATSMPSGSLASTATSNATRAWSKWRSPTTSI